jgi:hypothetical protein
MLKYRVTYSDGQEVRIPVVGGKHIGDWYNPRDVSDAVVAWAERHPVSHRRLGFYLYLWQNPSPEREVQSITIESLNQSVPAILAVTLGR